MKLPNSGPSNIFELGEVRRNLPALLQYLTFLVGIILLFAVIFQLIMVRVEGQSHSWITAIYWTLVTMSTLGFGDVVFASDIGRIFTVVVLVSGTVLLLVVLPFTFIRFFYAPWLEAQVRQRAPRHLSSTTSGHVLISRYDEIASGLIERFAISGIPYHVIEPDPVAAAHLVNEGISAVTGDLDSRASYEQFHIDQARSLLANHDDATNTNITLTVREVSNTVPIIGLVEHEDSIDILELSGCTHVLPLKVRLGEYLANRASAGSGNADIIGSFKIGSFKELQVAEFSARYSPLAGLAVRDTYLRERTGLNIVGFWQRGHLVPAFPHTEINEGTILVVVGTVEQLAALDSILKTNEPKPDAPTLVIGAGTVGTAATRALKRKGVSVHVVERDARASDQLRGVADQIVVGDANDRHVLMKAGLEEAGATLLSMNDDTINIYLSVYCRRLKPELRLVSRITHNRNLEAIHRAGADFALSYASLGTEAIISVIEGHEPVILDQNVDLFSLRLPRALENKKLADSGIGSQTGLCVVAIQQGDTLKTHLQGSLVLEAGTELVMIGRVDQHKAFIEAFG